MHIEPFVMERWQSTFEHHVDLNLSDSGVHPLSVRELLEPDEHEAMLDQQMIYTQSNGTPELRDRIADLYSGAARGNVEVTNGGAEANYITACTLVEAGDEVVLQLPNYMQLWGVLRSIGANVKTWGLRPDVEQDTWHSDLGELEKLVTPKTKLIAICNPNNPSGAVLGAEELDHIAQIAEKHDAWTLVDEIYHGAELNGTTTPSMWGRHDKVVVTNSLSKAYGLPGLRLGWILAPEDTIEECWGRHDYTTISPGALSDHLAEKALEPARRARILERTHELLSTNLGIAMEWVESQDQLKTITPEAGAFLMLKYDQAINSSELAERLRVEKSILVVPGDHFGMDGWLRVGFGDDTDTLKRGLDRLSEMLLELNTESV